MKVKGASLLSGAVIFYAAHLLGQTSNSISDQNWPILTIEQAEREAIR